MQVRNERGLHSPHARPNMILTGCEGLFDLMRPKVGMVYTLLSIEVNIICSFQEARDTQGGPGGPRRKPWNGYPGLPGAPWLSPGSHWPSLGALGLQKKKAWDLLLKKGMQHSCVLERGTREGLVIFCKGPREPSPPSRSTMGETLDPFGRPPIGFVWGSRKPSGRTIGPFRQSSHGARLGLM